MSARFSKQAAKVFFVLAVVAGMTARLYAQGCVAAHSNERPMDELVSVADDHTPGGFSIHNLTLNLGYRVFNSNK